MYTMSGHDFVLLAKIAARVKNEQAKGFQKHLRVADTVSLMNGEVFQLPRKALRVLGQTLDGENEVTLDVIETDHESPWNPDKKAEMTVITSGGYQAKFHNIPVPMSTPVPIVYGGLIVAGKGKAADKASSLETVAAKIHAAIIIGQRNTDKEEALAKLEEIKGLSGADGNVVALEGLLKDIAWRMRNLASLPSGRYYTNKDTSRSTYVEGSKKAVRLATTVRLLAKALKAWSLLTDRNPFEQLAELAQTWLHRAVEQLAEVKSEDDYYWRLDEAEKRVNERREFLSLLQDQARRYVAKLAGMHAETIALRVQQTVLARCVIDQKQEIEDTEVELAYYNKLSTFPTRGLTLAVTKLNAHDFMLRKVVEALGGKQDAKSFEAAKAKTLDIMVAMPINKRALDSLEQALDTRANACNQRGDLLMGFYDASLDFAAQCVGLPGGYHHTSEYGAVNRGSGWRATTYRNARLTGKERVNELLDGLGNLKKSISTSFGYVEPRTKRLVFELKAHRASGQAEQADKRLSSQRIALAELEQELSLVKVL